MITHPSHTGRCYREVTVELTDERDEPGNRDIVGHYIITFNEPCPEDQVACAALNIFHTQVPIKNSGDFEFMVWDFDGHGLGETDDWDPDIATIGGSIEKRND